jgi:hypothetical protein
MGVLMGCYGQVIFVVKSSYTPTYRVLENNGGAFVNLVVLEGICRTANL